MKSMQFFKLAVISVALSAPWTARADGDHGSSDTLTAALVDNTSSSAYFKDLVVTTTVDSLFCVLVTFTKLDNVTVSTTQRLFNLSGKGQTTLLSLSQTDAQAGYSYGYSYQYRHGHSGTAHNANHKYRLPYSRSESYTIGQEYFGSFSHQNDYALDWNMPVGTTLRASRGGTVIDLKEDSNEGGVEERHKEMANYVTIGHDDGSQAVYVHLQQNGALVELGDTVTVGQAIGLSGNTGYSSGPHLHFAVSQLKSPADFATVPTRFVDENGTVLNVNAAGSITSLVEGVSYQGSAFDSTSVITGDLNSTIAEDAVASGDLNAVDADGLTDGSYFTVSASPSNGSASIDQQTGNWTYTPNSNYFGNDSFKVTVTDDLDGTTLADLRITVNSVDDPSTITGDFNATIEEGGVAKGDLNAVDTEGLTDGSYFTVSSSPANGSATIDQQTGSWSYTPNTSFYGSDSFKVSVTDDLNGTTVSDMNVTVTQAVVVSIRSGTLLENKWRTGSWFGTFYDRNESWIFHPQMGWLYPVEQEDLSVWLYHEARGWAWTRSSSFPWLYFNKTGGWKYFLAELGLYDENGRQWETIEP